MPPVNSDHQDVSRLRSAVSELLRVSRSALMNLSEEPFTEDESLTVQNFTSFASTMENIINSLDDLPLSYFLDNSKYFVTLTRDLVQLKPVKIAARQKIKILSDSAEKLLAAVAEIARNDVNHLPPINEYTHQVLANQVRMLKNQLESVTNRAAEIEHSMMRRFSELATETSTKFNSYKTQLDESLKSTEASLSETKSKLEKSQLEVNKMVGILANTTLAGGHYKHAMEEKQTANSFRRWSMILMSAMAIAIAVKLLFLTDKIDTHIIAAHFTVTLLFSLLIGYLVRQSAVHRAQHQKHFRTALDLAALNPFMEDLDKTSRDSIKRQLAEKIFVPDQSSSSPDLTGYGAQEVIIKLIDKIEPAKAKP